MALFLWCFKKSLKLSNFVQHLVNFIYPVYFKPRTNTRFYHTVRQTYILSIYKNISTLRLGSEMNHPQICRQKIIIFVYEFNLLLNDFFFIFTVSEAYTGGGQWHKNDQVSKIRGGGLDPPLKYDSFQEGTPYDGHKTNPLKKSKN